MTYLLRHRGKLLKVLAFCIAYLERITINNDENLLLSDIINECDRILVN